jgi:hypothetical protein
MKIQVLTHSQPMTLIMILNTADHIAALQAYVATLGHQMNATVTPVLGGDGSVTVQLNN